MRWGFHQTWIRNVKKTLKFQTIETHWSIRNDESVWTLRPILDPQARKCSGHPWKRGSFLGFFYDEIQKHIKMYKKKIRHHLYLVLFIPVHVHVMCTNLYMFVAKSTWPSRPGPSTAPSHLSNRPPQTWLTIICWSCYRFWTCSNQKLSIHPPIKRWQEFSLSFGVGDIPCWNWPLPGTVWRSHVLSSTCIKGLCLPSWPGPWKELHLQSFGIFQMPLPNGCMELLLFKQSHAKWAFPPSFRLNYYSTWKS